MKPHPGDEAHRAQNVYNDPMFFARYAQMERFKAEWGAAMEHEAFLEVIGDVTQARVLDLGCGAGQLCLHLGRSRRRVGHRHRTLSTLVNALIDAGFVIARLVEPTPASDWLRERPGDCAERHRPIFLLVRARWRSNAADG